jgi:hypothetical protein
VRSAPLLNTLGLFGWRVWSWGAERAVAQHARGGRWRVWRWGEVRAVAQHARGGRCRVKLGMRGARRLSARMGGRTQGVWSWGAERAVAQHARVAWWPGGRVAGWRVWGWGAERAPTPHARSWLECVWRWRWGTPPARRECGTNRCGRDGRPGTAGRRRGDRRRAGRLRSSCSSPIGPRGPSRRRRPAGRASGVAARPAPSRRASPRPAPGPRPRVAPRSAPRPRPA